MKEILIDGVTYIPKEKQSTGYSMARTYSAGVFYGMAMARAMETKVCSACGGSGEAWYNFGDARHPDERLEACRTCMGSGQIIHDDEIDEYFGSLQADTRHLLKKRKSAIQIALEAIKRFKKS